MQAPDQPSKRDQILDAAVAVFSARGFQSTPVDEVAKEAGVAKGTLYLYFRSKEEMYLEAFRAVAEKMHGLSRVQTEEAASTWGKIRAYVSVRLDLSETHREFLRIYLSEFVGSMTRRKEWGERMRTLFQQDMELLRKVVCEGMEKGELRPLPVEPMVAFIAHSVQGITGARLTGLWPEGNNPDPDLVVAILKHGLAMPGA